LAAAFRRPKSPSWTTACEIIHDNSAFRLRDFGARASLSAHPVLVVPPEVNQSYIVDFAPGQSLVGVLREAGFSRVAALEWLSATSETRERDIDDSIQAIIDCIDILGGRVNLIGLCQGGWESAVAAALAPERVCSLTLVAAPIDFHAGLGSIKMLSSAIPMSVYRAMVDMGDGVMRGDLISAGFDSLVPFERYFLKFLSLFNHLDDQAWMNRFEKTADWYHSPKDLPGPLYLRSVKELFKENRLIHKRMHVLGQSVDLERIVCPLALVAGRKDHITPAPQVWAAQRAMGSSDVFRLETPGGHIGSFMGRQELAEYWPDIIGWLLDRDVPPATPRKRQIESGEIS